MLFVQQSLTHQGRETGTKRQSEQDVDGEQARPPKETLQGSRFAEWNSEHNTSDDDRRDIAAESFEYGPLRAGAFVFHGLTSL